jgi:hypothetical protein
VTLYACEQCTSVENTALGQYWGSDKKLCSECATGAWHGQFRKRLLKDTNYVVQADGTLSPPGGWPQVNSTWGGNKPMTSKVEDSSDSAEARHE